jgi:outer membrane protein/protease secretion system outer membrane protein
MLVRLCGAYFEALMAQDQLGLVLSVKESYAGQLQGAKRTFEAGQGTRTDIDDAQARYDMVLAQELEASQNVGHTRRQLQVIVNQPVDGLARLNPDRLQLAPPLPANPDEWVARGVEVNAELRAMRANIESATQELEKARSGHMPTVDLVAQRSRSLSENQVTINQFYLTSQVGLQVNIPIYAGGYASSQIRQAVANLEKHRQQYEARRREVDLQIRKEFQNVAEGVLKVKAQEQAERSSDQALFSNQKGYQAGTRTQIDILNAQQQRMNVRRDLAQARYLYLMARVRLQGLVGSLNEDEIMLINTWLSEPSA